MNKPQLEFELNKKHYLSCSISEARISNRQVLIAIINKMAPQQMDGFIELKKDEDFDEQLYNIEYNICLFSNNSYFMFFIETPQEVTKWTTTQPYNGF